MQVVWAMQREPGRRGAMSLSLIDRVEACRALTRGEAEALMEEILSGRMATPEIVRVLMALNRRTLEVQELAGFAQVMRKHATRVFVDGEARPTNMVDTCGTGGDGSKTFNISTAAAIVAAAAGARVAKHGNRAASSKCGSADVLEALGVRIDLPFERIGRGIREIGIGFLFAQAAHAATRHATPARKQIGVRTVFNLLGPLTNPAQAQAQVLGVFSAEVVDVMAGTLAELGTQHAFVVHGTGKLDEISLAGPTIVAEVREGNVRKYHLMPEDFGKKLAPLAAIHGGNAVDNAKLVLQLLAGSNDGEGGRARHDIVVVNAAAALVAAGSAANFREGAELAEKAVRSGAAQAKLQELRRFGQAS